jgi:hypothetical protein
MPSEVDLPEKLARVERRLQAALVMAAFGLALGVLALVGRPSSLRTTTIPGPTESHSSGILRVRELDIIDKNGVTRVKIGSPLPNAVVNGKHNKTRGGGPADTMSGMLLFDAEGVERSGYATVDHGYSNVLLTLDGKHEQHAMFISEPNGATTLRLFNAAAKDRIDVAIDKDGPSISMVRDGKEVSRSPKQPQQ